MDLETYPREALRRQLVAVGIPRERHRMANLVDMLPIRLQGKPYEDFDADIVAEVLVYLVGKGLIAVPGPELALTLILSWLQVVVSLAGAFLIVNQRAAREA